MGRRKNGQGLIRQRKDGRWEGRCVVGYDEKNLPITKNVLAKTKREVEEKLKALKETVQKPVVKTAADMPFGEYIDYWYRNFCELSIAATTRLKYENDIYKHIIPGIGKLPLAALKKSDLEKFYAEQMKSGNLDRNGVGDKKLSGAVIRSMHTRIKCALDQALKEGLVNRNEAIGCKLPPKKNKEIEVLSHEEIARLLIQAKEEGFYELILLGLATGMRRGELLGLKWDDINFTTGELSIRREYTTLGSDYIISTPKTKSSVRSVHLPQSVLNILGEYRETVSSEWVSRRHSIRRIRAVRRVVAVGCRICWSAPNVITSRSTVCGISSQPWRWKTGWTSKRCLQSSVTLRRRRPSAYILM